MKYITVLLCFVLPIAKMQIARAQDNTQIELTKLFAQEWGFLTFYTSVVSQGEKDWFNLLVYGIEELEKSADSKRLKGLSAALLSKVSVSDAEYNSNWKIQEKDTLLNPNLYSWMDNPIFDEETRLKFNILRRNPVIRPSCFRPTRYLPSFYSDTAQYMPLIRRVPPVTNHYEAVSGFLVFWNAVNYYSAYPIGGKYCWDKTMDEFIPQFLSLKKYDGKEFNNQYRDLMRQVVSKLEDSHTGYMKFIDGSQGYIQVDYIDSICYVTKIHPKLSEAYEIQSGDAILEKDGVSMTIIHDDLVKYFAGSNPLVTDRNILPYLLTFTKPFTHLKILKQNNSIAAKEVKLIDISNLKATDNLAEFRNWKPYDGTYSQHRDTVYNNTILYINVGEHTERSLKKQLEKNSDKQYLIFDFRNYPNNLYFVFTDPGKKVFYYSNSSIPDKSYNEFNNDKIPGYFQKETKSVPSSIDRPTLINWEKFNKNHNKSVYLLCNEYSQSKTESVLAYFSCVTKGTIVGRNTAGVPGSAATIYLPGKLYLMFTLGEGYDMRQGLISGKGICPDVYVKKEIKSIVEGKDEILDKAFELIYQKNALAN